MDYLDEVRGHALRLITTGTPSEFWREVDGRFRWSYGESFASVRADPGLVDEQRICMLWQRRHYQCERALMDLAISCGLSASAKVIQDNNCHYVLVRGGSIQIIQKYTPSDDAMPAPSQFRKGLAKSGSLYRNPQLQLGDIEPSFFLPPELNGILLHSPMGNRFEEGHQKLGVLRFCLPWEDYSGWAVQFSPAEILAAYQPQTKREDKARPSLKPKKKPNEGREQ